MHTATCAAFESLARHAAHACVFLVINLLQICLPIRLPEQPVLFNQLLCQGPVGHFLGPSGPAPLGPSIMAARRRRDPRTAIYQEPWGRYYREAGLREVVPGKDFSGFYVECTFCAVTRTPLSVYSTCLLQDPRDVIPKLGCTWGQGPGARIRCPWCSKSHYWH